MRPRLLETLVASKTGSAGGRRWHGLPVSLALHAAVLAALVLLPPFTSGELPPIVTPRPLPLPGPLISVVVRPSSSRSVSAPRPRPDTARSARSVPTPPIEAVPIVLPDPDDVLLEPERLAPCLVNCGLSPGFEGLSGGEGPGSGSSSQSTGGAEGPVRPGYKGVTPPKKLRHVNPVYPEIARIAHVQGTVELECIIGTNGHVTSVHILRGIPLLDVAATDAVRQWIYTPTLLNGVPVEVVMTIYVKFWLN